MIPVRAVLLFGSGLYLAGLGIYMGLAVRDGFVILRADRLMFFELLFVVGLILFQGAMFAGEIKGMFKK